MDYAASHKMAIGRDVVFTYGPYADITSRLYNPAMRGLVMSTTALLAAAFALGLAAQARPWMMLCTLAVLPVIYSSDSIFFVLPLPAMLLCASSVRRTPPATLYLAVLALAPATGLLPLIKLSYLPVTLISAAVICGLLWMAGKRRLAIGHIVLVCVGVPALWCASGQAIGDLMPYLKNGSAIIAGYAGAMGTLGPVSHIAIAFAGAVLILVMLGLGTMNLPRWPARLLVLGVASLIFVAVKASFVRQDPSHELLVVGASALSLLILATWLPALPAAIAACAGIFILVGPFNEVGGPGGFHPALTGLQAELQGGRTLLFDPAQYAAKYAAGVAEISHLPWHPPGTADIYSQGQSNLLASGLIWAPRPVIQSYSAYTAALARLNARHLTGPAPPDNVYFRPEPIDGRLPALEDGASWPALLSLYTPAAYDFAKDLVLLRHDRNATVVAPGPPARAGRARLGQTIDLPDATALWATIDVKPSLAGRLAGILGKTPLLHLVLKLTNGGTRDYSFVPGMGPSGFLISPAVTTSWDFIRLRRDTSSHNLWSPRVASFTLEAGPNAHWVWQRKYHFSVAPIAFPPDPNRTLRGLPEPAARPMPAMTRATCYLDEADGSTVTDAPVTAGSTLQVDGWGAFDVQAGVAADSAELGFVNAAGQAWSVPALLGPRYGVGAHFNHPLLLNVHVTAIADPSHLPPGPYKMQLFLSLAGQTLACPTRLSLTVPPTTP